MELLESLNPQQKKAVTYGEGPLLIVAGAGTGKTTVITQRVAWLIEQGKAKSDEILAVTFTDKAATEMEERIDRLLPLGYYDLWISTFHAFCQRVLKDHAIEIGLPGDFKLLDNTAQWLLVRQNLDKFELDYYRPLGNPTKFIHSLLKHFSRAKDEAIRPEEYLDYVENVKLNLDQAEASGGKAKKAKKQTSKKTSEQLELDAEANESARFEEVAQAYHIYQQLLLENNALDFGDLINYTLELFKQRPAILKAYRQKFKYILVDEFQDTNWAQYELIKLLAAPENNITVVGDDDQSIYKFRGASISNILQFNQDYPKAEIVSISTNYRSQQDILDLSHKFIKLNDPNRLEAQSLHGQRIDKKLKAHDKGKATIEYLVLPDHYAEAAGVVQKIHDLGQKNKDTTWNDFAILVRANAHADIFVSALEQAGISYQYVASKGLYTKSVILNLISFLKLLQDPHDSGAFWRVLNWPVFKLSEQTLLSLNSLARRKSWSLYQAVASVRVDKKIAEAERRAVNQVFDLLEKAASLARDKRPREVLLTVLQDSGYLEWLARDAQAGTHGSYLEQFDKQLQRFEESAVEPTVRNLLAELMMELESGETGNLAPDLAAGPEAVKVMTIHAAKGLEFKYVFITNLVDKRFPSLDRKEPIMLPDDLVKEILPEGDIHLQEERRLMYVAMTRAKQGLYLTAAEEYGGKLKKKPSRFIGELGLTRQESKSSAAKTKSKAKPKAPRPTAYQLPTRFSYTQLKRFADCPYQYYQDYILRIPQPGNYHFSFGRTIHETLRNFFDLVKERSGVGQADLFGQGQQKGGKAKKTVDKKIPELKELLNIYEQQWIGDWYDDAKHKEEYRKKGEQALKDYYKLVSKSVPQVELLEKPFRFKLVDDEQNVYTIAGVIDRMDRLPDGQVEIIDYKTGRYNEKYIDKQQLMIYQIATQEILGEQVAQLTYWYIESNQPFSFVGSAKELTKLKTKMLELIHRIRSADFAKLLQEHKCRYCEQRI